MAKNRRTFCRGVFGQNNRLFHIKIQDKPLSPPEQKLVPENPPQKNLRQVELRKTTKTIRGIYRNTEPQKNAQFFPLKSIKFTGEGVEKGVFLKECSESCGVFSAQRSKVKTPFWDTTLAGANSSCKRATLRYAHVKQASEAWPRRPKKTLGRENVRVKKDLGGGGNKRPLPPPPDKDGFWGPCDPNQTLALNGTRQGTSIEKRLPLKITFPRGGRDHPLLCPLRRRAPARAHKKCGRKQHRRGKNNTRQKKNRQQAPLPPRVRERASEGGE